ncbi:MULTISPECIES: TIGR02530 family flagellar biosynthesis protein [unclassified Halanaerobium]|uniref:TIGR02530 family flagellar biosynthesis protein n=1 Tax=unclassified Halanaerobium TaxID=2641197 RepID=UPI000DF2D115|nr:MULTISPECIES: TIGR02530 family flagellar biosynthesis protein [unclassified Halanaerobium]RCW47687.1 flagellar operon protein [Halanaerobium sp. MA284_MarDTE_T2]RCW84669.1 flagellar operon protein [Halanaerobium sp. DL-01]
MDNRLKINQPIRPLEQNKNINRKNQQKNDKNVSFKELLNEKLADKNKINFSKHAQKRLDSRSISVSEKDLDQLTSGIEKAKAKGARDSLIMVNNVAYIVSVENNTVVTAVDGKSMKENVFTNIDSAVIMK